MLLYFMKLMLSARWISVSLIHIIMCIVNLYYCHVAVSFLICQSNDYLATCKSHQIVQLVLIFFCFNVVFEETTLLSSYSFYTNFSLNCNFDIVCYGNDPGQKHLISFLVALFV
jgi:hypothetical protein